MCFCTPSIRTPFCPRCNTAMFQRIMELQSQLKSEKVSHAACEKQNLLEYSELTVENERLNALCAQLAEALEYACKSVPPLSTVPGIEAAISAWREMKGERDETSISP